MAPFVRVLDEGLFVFCIAKFCITIKKCLTGFVCFAYDITIKTNYNGYGKGVVVPWLPVNKC